jgi:hypothetical protein
MHTQIFWSAGLGDCFCLEATMTDEYRKSIGKMYWATRSRTQLAPLFSRLPSFPYLKEHVSLWDDFQDGFCFKNIEEAYEKSLHRHLVTGPVEDWSVIKRFHQPQPFVGSSFVKYKLASINHFNLPEEYAVVCPYSNVNKKSIQEWKRFFPKDWEWLIQHLAKLKLPGVVLNVGDDMVPENKWIINLSNKTKLGEAIEITKKASHFFGIDTGLSVISAQILPADRIVVSTVNTILWHYKHVYYAPQTEWDFIVPHLGATDVEIRAWRDEFGKVTNEVEKG